MSTSFVQAQLAAGGMVAATAKCDAAATEKIVARTYGAPVLGSRKVVRLTSDRLVPAEDLAMEFLGLEAQEISEPIAVQNRMALDFAHWALVNQPQHARYALDLVKRMKGAVRKATSKPGHAWDQYTAMAEELNKSVRHFLPAFWESAARAFKDLGNQTYAGRALNKALEAERVHALEVDREHRRDAVLEFTLSGCLSGKALTDYSKDLSNQFEPDEAYETFKDLVIRRTLGGMPPVANVAADMSRMAKAASLDANAELESVLRAIITSPAMSRAPMQFWKSVKAPVKRIAAQDESFAMWLLVHTDPQPRYDGESHVWQWIDLLDHWDVLPLLSRDADTLPEAVEIPGGRAGWFGRLASVETSPNKRVFELLEQMADVLRQEGQPIQLVPQSRWRREVDVDVVEACLAMGLEVAEPTGNWSLDFDGWLRETVDHPRRNSQLSHLAADRRFAGRLRDAIPDLVKFRGENRGTRHGWGRTLAPRRPFDEAAANHPAVRDAWWQYLDLQLGRVESGGIVDLEEGLESLRESTGPKTVAEFPELLPRIKAVDIVGSLQRTLAAGVLDEYGWEALDEVDDGRMIPRAAGRRGNALHWVFPRLASLQDDRVTVVDPEQHRTHSDVHLKKDQELVVLLPAGDDVLVACRDSSRSWHTFARWLSDPKQEHEQQGYFYSWEATAIVPLGDSAFFIGTRAIQPGDASLPVPEHSRPWFSDGQRFWRLKESVSSNWGDEDDDAQANLPAVAEIDPVSGKELRDSVPPFFETNLPAGAKVLWHQSCLLPCPDQSGPSPLGACDGLVGWRVVRRRDGAIESSGIDGRQVVFEAADQPSGGILAAVGLMDKPASNASWIVTNDGRLMDEATRIAIAVVGGNRTKYFAGQPAQLPTRFFHLMRVRSEASSRKLRKTTATQARTLLEAARIEHEALKTKEDRHNPDPARSAGKTAVSEWLAEAPPRLVTGVARIARVAAEEDLSLKKLLARLEPTAAEAGQTQGDPAQEIDVHRAAEGFSQMDIQPFPKERTSHYDVSADLASHLLMVARFFAGEPCEEMPRADCLWFQLLRNPAAAAWRCFWRTATNPELGATVPERMDTPWLEALRCLAKSNLLNMPGSYKVYECKKTPDEKVKKASIESRLRPGRPIAFEQGKSRYVAYEFNSYAMQNSVFILEYATDGKHKPPKGFAVEATHDLKSGWKSSDVLRFAEVAREVQKLPLPTAEELDAASAQLGVHPIAVAIAYMGDLRTVRHGQEKLTKELRQHYGWKVKDIQVAISQLESVERPEHVEATGALHNAAGALAAGRKASFDLMVKKWKESGKHSISIPADLAKSLERASHRYHGVTVKDFAELVADPSDASFIARRQIRVGLNSGKRSWQPIEIQYAPEIHFYPPTAYPDLIRMIAVVNYQLPVGAPVRSGLPEVIDQLRRFVDDDATLLPFGGSSTQPGDRENVDTAGTIAAFANHLGPLEQAESGLYHGDNGLVVSALMPPHVALLFRASELRGRQSLERLVAIARMTWEYLGTGEDQLDCAEFVLALRGEGFTEIAEDNRRPTAPEGSWQQDPRVSAPAMVEAAAGRLGVGHDAAVLYLQTLALADPSTANVRRWNEWPTKQYKTAAEELVAGNHVVAAKRERAGREIFLPGGWEALKQPNLPLESWKLPLFGYESIEPLRGGGAEVITCKRSIGGLFEAAWKRIEAGDTPRYEEATTRRKRK